MSIQIVSLFYCVLVKSKGTGHYYNCVKTNLAEPVYSGIFWCISLYFKLCKADLCNVYFIVFQCWDTGCWYFNCVKTKLAERERKQVSSTGISTRAELGNLLHLFHAFQLYLGMEGSIHTGSLGLHISTKTYLHSEMNG